MSLSLSLYIYMYMHMYTLLHTHTTSVSDVTIQLIITPIKHSDVTSSTQPYANRTRLIYGHST